MPMDVLKNFPQNPGLGVVHYASDIDNVVDWIQTINTTLAILVAMYLFSLDVLIQCHLLPLNSTIAFRNIFLIGQFKFSNKKCLDAKTITYALTFLHPNYLNMK